jgi:hypothetical protein
MFDTAIIEVPISPDTDAISKFAAAATSDEASFQPLPMERWNFSNTLGLRKKKKSQ